MQAAEMRRRKIVGINIVESGPTAIELQFGNAPLRWLADVISSCQSLRLQCNVRQK